MASAETVKGIATEFLSEESIAETLEMLEARMAKYVKGGDVWKSLTVAQLIIGTKKQQQQRYAATATRKAKEAEAAKSTVKK